MLDAIVLAVLAEHTAVDVSKARPQGALSVA
jgi:hypothetical protein